MTDAQFLKAMETGKLMSAEVLPKVSKELYKASQAGGAYEEALKGLRVQKGKFITESQRAADTIFKSGFEEGLAALYKELSEQLSDTGKSQEDLGNIYKRFFQLVKGFVKVVTPLLSAFIQVASKGVDLLAQSAEGWGKFFSILHNNSPVLTTVALGIGGISLALKSLYGKVILVLGAFQELASLFDDKLVGALEKKLGRQMNLLTGETSKIVTIKVKQEDGSFKDEMYTAGDYIKKLSIDFDGFKDVESFKKVLESHGLTFQGVAEKMGISTADLTNVVNKQGVNSLDLKQNVLEIGASFKGLDDIIKGQGWSSVSEFVKIITKSTTNLDFWTGKLNDSAKTELKGVETIKEIFSDNGTLTTGLLTLTAAIWAAVTLFKGLKGMGGMAKGASDAVRSRMPKSTPKSPKPTIKPTPNNIPYQPKTVTPAKLLGRGLLKGVGEVGKIGLKMAPSTIAMEALAPTKMGDGTFSEEDMKRFDYLNSFRNQMSPLNLNTQSAMQPQILQSLLRSGVMSGSQTSTTKVEAPVSVTQHFTMQFDGHMSEQQIRDVFNTSMSTAQDMTASRLEAYISRGR